MKLTPNFQSKMSKFQTCCHGFSSGSGKMMCLWLVVNQNTDTIKSQTYHLTQLIHLSDKRFTWVRTGCIAFSFLCCKLLLTLMVFGYREYLLSLGLIFGKHFGLLDLRDFKKFYEGKTISVRPVCIADMSNSIDEPLVLTFLRYWYCHWQLIMPHWNNWHCNLYW